MKLKTSLTALLLLSTLSLGNSPILKNIINVNRHLMNRKDLIECIEKTKLINYFDKDTDYYQSPHETDSLKTGNCADKAIYLQYLLKEKNINAVLRLGLLRKWNPKVAHFWLEAKNADTTYLIEPTAVTSKSIYIIDNPKMKIKGNVPKDRYEYLFPNKLTKRLIKEYEKRNRVILEVKFN